MAASSVNGAPATSVNGLMSSEPPGFTHASRTICRIEESTTAAEVPQTNANISSRGGSGSHRSSHR